MTGTGLLPLSAEPVTEIAPALAPLLVRPFLFAGLPGISFEGTRFTVWRDGKKVGDHTGDVLFTHLGLFRPGYPRCLACDPARQSGQALVRWDDEA